MKKRVNLVEQFSTFLDLREIEVRWLSDNKLRRQMDNYLTRDPSLTNSEYWGLLFRQKWLDEGKGNNHWRDHLYSYLQEPCYWVADEIYQNYQDRCEYTIKDYFNLGVLQFDKLISNFNPKLNTKLYTFASQHLKWRIIDRMRESDRTFGYTTWSLLLHCSEKRLTEALITQVSSENIDNYLSAWQYYQEIYAQAQITLKGNLQKPRIEIWQKITEKYNLDTNSKVTFLEIEDWLTTSGKALFNYLSMTNQTTSLDQPRGEEGESRGGDFIKDETARNPLDRLEDFEELLSYRRNIKKISAWLKEEIPQINLARQLEFEMYYGQNLTLVEIAKDLNPPVHYTSLLRRMRTVRKKLAKNFIEWAKTNLHTPLESNDIETMSEALEQWLKHYYQETNNNSTMED